MQPFVLTRFRVVGGKGLNFSCLCIREFFSLVRLVPLRSSFVMFHCSFFRDNLIRNKSFFLNLPNYLEQEKRIHLSRKLRTHQQEEIETRFFFFSTRATPTRGLKPVGRLGERETYAITASGYLSEGYRRAKH